MGRVWIAILVLWSVSASAAESFALMGLGVASCGEFAKLYRLDPEEGDRAFFSWSQGFMSGLNFQKLGEGGRSKNLNAMTMETQRRSIRRYCDQHPLGQVLDAVLEIYQKLPDNR